MALWPHYYSRHPLLLMAYFGKPFSIFNFAKQYKVFVTKVQTINYFKSQQFRQLPRTCSFSGSILCHFSHPATRGRQTFTCTFTCVPFEMNSPQGSGMEASFRSIAHSFMLVTSQPADVDCTLLFSRLKLRINFPVNSGEPLGRTVVCRVTFLPIKKKKLLCWIIILFHGWIYFAEF